MKHEQCKNMFDQNEWLCCYRKPSDPTDHMRYKRLRANSKEELYKMIRSFKINLYKSLGMDSSQL